ncbi:MAG: hypothetical protein SFZ23_01100 [Planctomycetota bacterium]|nr:hypothetical protein [Planctomycetota bacterium]
MSMAIAGGLGYTIPRSTGCCAATARAFSAGEQHVSVLTEDTAAGKLVRFDYSTEAWSQGARPPTRVFAHWRSVMSADAASDRPVLLSDEELVDLVEQMADVSEIRQQTFRYLLTLLLIRRRVLKHESTRTGLATDGQYQTIMMVRTRGTPTPASFAVVEPKLGVDEVAAAVEQLGAIMPGAQTPSANKAASERSNSAGGTP